MLTLAGQTLIGDNENMELESYIKKFIPTDSFIPWLRRSWPGFGLQHCTWPLGYQYEPYFKLNRFRWFSKACRFGFGHFLCNSDAVNIIGSFAFTDTGGYNTIPLAFGNPESNDSGTIFPLETVVTQVYLLPPTPLSGIRGLTQANDGVESLYLLTVVDPRYFWWQRFLNYNITTTTTWQNLIDAIASQLGVTITVDTIDPAYLQPSVEMFQLPYEPIPIILDAIAENIGQRVAVDYATGGVFLQKYATALQALNNDMAQNADTRFVLSGGQRFASPL